MSTQTLTLRLKVSPEVARFVTRQAPRELRLAAARGACSLSGRDLLTALFFLCHGDDAEIRGLALRTVRGMPAAELGPAAADPELHPQLLDFLARARFDDPAVMAPLLANPALTEATLAHVAGRAAGAVLDLLLRLRDRWRRSAAVVAALQGNPQAAGLAAEPVAGDVSSGPEETQEPAETEEAEEGEEEAPEEEEINLSKYQQAMEMGVADKIKTALTGDKEWRTIFLKDPNKLVSSAVLKNPRITEGEVLTVAKNKSASEELIRLILLNREWLKRYEMKKALVMHPRTPLPRALRFMEVLGEKDIKQLAKSRNVSQVIVNNARRLLLARQKKNS
jgi:hypothetical protein